MREGENSDFAKVAAIFERVCELSGDERQLAVTDACDGDQALQDEVLALLERHDSANSLPAAPAPTSAPETATEANAIPPPERIGHYRILEKIADGGMGSVYLAEQLEPMRRQVAVKLLKPGMDSREIITRFEAERQALALMDHPNIARVFDGGVTEQGYPFFAMEFVRGEPLTDFCDRKSLSLRQRLEIFLKVCAAVQHAHQKGVVHRDLKPSNVLVTGNADTAEPKIIDFGIAKAVGATLTDATFHTAHGLVVGTPEYMSPEQAEGRTVDIDTRSDVYSLGLLLYEMLVGRLPFSRETLSAAGFQEALRILRESEPPRPSVRLTLLDHDKRRRVVEARESTEIELRRELRRDLDWVVLRALEKDRERRYASASEFASDVERYLGGEPVEAGPPSVSYRMGKFARRHRLEVAAAALLILVLASAAITVGLQARRLRVALEDSRQQTRRAETVSGLLTDAFQEADPMRRTVDREVTAREVLERGAESLGDLSLAPEVRSALSSSMANAFLGLNDRAKAEELAATALEAAEPLGGEALGSALILSAQVQRVQRRFERAEGYSRRAVEHADGSGLQPETRVRAREALGSDLHELARFAEADAVLAEAEAIAEQTPELDELTRASLLLTWALNAQSLADYERSLALGRRALEGLTRASDNPIHWAQARRLIAVSLYQLGRLEEAIELDAESYVIARDRLGEEHPLTRRMRDDWALRLHFSHQGRKALELYEQSVALSRRIDPDGPGLPSQLNNLGLIQQGLDLLPEAEATFREAIELQTALVGNDHHHPGYHVMNLGRVLHDAGRFEEAEVQYRRALELWERLLPPGHTLIGNVEIWFGGLLVETGRAADGRPRIERGLSIRDADRGGNDWQTAEARSWLGAALAELGELEEAERLLVEAYRTILEQRGKDWRRTRWALSRLLGFYRLTGDEAALGQWAEEFRSLYEDPLPPDSSRRWGVLAQASNHIAINPMQTP